MKKRALKAVILVAVVGLFLAYWLSNRPTRWNEEVQLRSGEVLTVRRTIQFKEYQPLGGGGGGADTPVSELEFVAPAGSDYPARWSQPSLLPMVLDRDPQTGEWFIVATFYMCNTWRELGRPKLPYAEFRYRSGQWLRVPLSAGVIGTASNVLIPNQADVKRSHTLSTKRELMSRPTMSHRFKVVIPTWASNC